MASEFHVGQKVVCVYDDGCTLVNLLSMCREGAFDLISVGDIATICNVYKKGGDLMLEFLEYPAPETESFDAGFLAKYFRPLVDDAIPALESVNAPAN